MDVSLLWVLCVVRERSLRLADPSCRVVLQRESVCVCVIECYQMQQSTSTSTRVDRGGQIKKGRKIKASLVRSNKWEQGMMLLTCIRSVVVWNQNCSTDCANLPTSQRFWVPCGKCGENSCNKANVFKNSVSGTQINISNGKLCLCVCAYHLCKLNLPNLIICVTNCKQFRH